MRSDTDWDLGEYAQCLIHARSVEKRVFEKRKACVCKCSMRLQNESGQGYKEEHLDSVT